MEYLEYRRRAWKYKLFLAIEFCIEVPRDGQRRESTYSKVPKLVAHR